MHILEQIQGESRNILKTVLPIGYTVVRAKLNIIICKAKLGGTGNFILTRMHRVDMEKNPKLQTGNITDKLAQFKDYWNPRVVGRLNGQMVKLVKFQGEFGWHAHAQEEEFFLVIYGQFTMEFRTHHLNLEKNDYVIVPKGVDHRPVAEEEVHVLLFEPESTLNTGDAQSDKTQISLEHI